MIPHLLIGPHNAAHPQEQAIDSPQVCSQHPYFRVNLKGTCKPVERVIPYQQIVI